MEPLKLSKFFIMLHTHIEVTEVKNAEPIHDTDPENRIVLSLDLKDQ